MKYLYTLVFTTIVFVSAQAQTKLTSGNLPAVGDQYTFNEFDATGISEGPAGANQTWDFSGIPAPYLTFDVKVTDADSDPDAANYPDANIVITNNYFGASGISAADDNIHYYKVDNTSITKVGRIDKGSNGQIVFLNTFNNEETQLTYPVELGTTGADTWSGQFTSLGMQVNWSNGINNYEADASGTLKLPGGITIENTIRIKRTRNYYSDFVFAPAQRDNNLWEWYTPGIPFPVFVLSEEITNGGSNALYGFTIDESDLQTVGISAKTNAVEGMTLWPNPASSQATISYNLQRNSEVQVAVFDITGMKVLDVFNGNQNTGKWENTIDLSKLADGVYFVTINTNDSVVTKKLVINN